MKHSKDSTERTSAPGVHLIEPFGCLKYYIDSEDCQHNQMVTARWPDALASPIHSEIDCFL